MLEAMTPIGNPRPSDLEREMLQDTETVQRVLHAVAREMLGDHVPHSQEMIDRLSYASRRVLMRLALRGHGHITDADREYIRRVYAETFPDLVAGGKR